MLQRQFSLVIAAICAMVLAGCGGVGGEPAPKIQFTSQVVFGDSLSDLGTYAVGAILALDGGRYTINSRLEDGSPAPTNWTEVLASTVLNLPPPCPAETGLDGSAGLGFYVPVTFMPECTSYAQGGARVTDPYGPGNKNLNPAYGGSALLGQLTVPIVTQIQNYLDRHDDSFSGTEIVFLLAGGNDAIVNTRIFLTAVDGGGDPEVAAANAVTAMATAGEELADYVRTMILEKGANYVLVANIPDLSLTPFGNQIEVAAPGTRAVIKEMIQAFNDQLSAGLSGTNVVLADLNTASAEQINHPADYQLTNVTDTACDLDAETNPLASSLVCNPGNLISADVSHYAFADTVHPTPYGNYLLALFIAGKLADRGWLNN